jgi:exodeoxyribonuclease-3
VSETLKILSWNVNGLRACDKKGFRRWLDGSGAFLAGIQEVRAQPEQLPLRLRAPRRWHCHVVAAQRKGYSGVASYARQEPDEISTSLGDERFDSEGRVQLLRFGKLVVANVYFPNGSGVNRDHSRVPYKLDFYRRLFDVLAGEKAGGNRVLVMGDFNTAHAEIELAMPKQNSKTSGFLAVEREELDRWLSEGYSDTFRLFNTEGGHYSWWSQRKGVREKNIGWRIDYVLACEEARPFVQGALIQSRVKGSDHCPVGVEVNADILGKD